MLMTADLKLYPNITTPLQRDKCLRKNELFMTTSSYAWLGTVRFVEVKTLDRAGWVQYCQCGCFRQIRKGDKLIEVRNSDHAFNKRKDGVGGWMFFAHGRAILDAQAMRDREEDALRRCPMSLRTAMSRKPLTQSPEYQALFRHVGQWGTALVCFRTPY